MVFGENACFQPNLPLAGFILIRLLPIALSALLKQTLLRLNPCDKKANTAQLWAKN